MKESRTELSPANYKVERSIVPKIIRRRMDFRVKTLILSVILNDSLSRAFDEYVKYIDHGIYEKNVQGYTEND